MINTEDPDIVAVATVTNLLFALVAKIAVTARTNVKIQIRRTSIPNKIRQNIRGDWFYISRLSDHNILLAE